MNFESRWLRIKNFYISRFTDRKEVFMLSGIPLRTFQRVYKKLEGNEMVGRQRKLTSKIDLKDV